MRDGRCAIREDRIRKLNDIGFAWDLNAKHWFDKFELLRSIHPDGPVMESKFWNAINLTVAEQKTRKSLLNWVKVRQRLDRRGSLASLEKNNNRTCTNTLLFNEIFCLSRHKRKLSNHTIATRHGPVPPWNQRFTL